MSVDDAAVERACASLRQSTDALVAKIDRRSQRFGGGAPRDAAAEEVLRGHVRHLVGHANHVLRTLGGKTASLRNAVAAFDEVTGSLVARFAALLESEGGGKTGKTVEREGLAIVREWFAILLRLRDGFVLLESGERRHPRDGDDDDSDSSRGGERFPSELSGAFRRDGRTRKFSSRNGYTGTGWDEVYDEDVGIRTRLVKALSDLDARWTPQNVLDRTFDDDGSGARLWEGAMDRLRSESVSLRGELNKIQRRFVDGVNERLSRGGRRRGRKGGWDSSDRLRLVTDSKSECISLGRADVARQGDSFTIRDAGGSLPLGMTVADWRRKFGLAAPEPKSRPRPKNISGEKARKKKRKIILEDSSDEEDDAALDEAPNRAKKERSKASADAAEEGHDGLAVRVREATDARVSRGAARGDAINELKRQHGADADGLERGRERMEEEQLRSRMAADDEDLRKGLLGDGVVGGRGGEGGGGLLPRLLGRCLASVKGLRRPEAYGDDRELLWRAQEYWTAFDERLMGWKERYQALLAARGGPLDESSDQVYMMRDNFREANIFLGNECIQIHEFFFKILQKNQQTQLSRSTPSSPSSLLEESLSDVCLAYLLFAEETFKTALNLVLEHERYQSNSSPPTIDEHWEKGQHYLLRGRAHNNIGQALYELAQYYEATNARARRQGEKRPNPRDLLTKARKEFDSASKMAKSLRRNVMAIHAHAGAENASTQNDCSWSAEAMVQSLEATKLESLASANHIACSWKLDRIKEARQTFDSFSESVDTSELISYASVAGVSHEEIAETLKDVYLIGARIAEMSTQSLESMAKAGGSWNQAKGKNIVPMMRKAMKRAASASDQLLSFVDRHSLEYYDKDQVATRGAIEEEEREILKWWDTTKMQAQKKMSDVVHQARTNDARNASLPRRDVAGDVGAVGSQAVAMPPRRIFVQDGGSFQGRSSSTRTRCVKKNQSGEERAVEDKFRSEFGAQNNNNELVPFGPGRTNATSVVYRNWGDEVLEECERMRCCPPLPDGISVEVRHALETKLMGIVQTKNVAS